MSSVLKSVLTVGSLFLASFIGNTVANKSRTVVVPEVQVAASDKTVTLNSMKKITKKSILRLSPSPSRVVYLDSQVDQRSAASTISKLKLLDTSTEPVFLLINSPGGEVLSGMQIISQMEGMQAPVYTVCTKICASMAAFIHQYGTKRYALDRSFLMFHPAAGGAEGQLPNMLSLLGTLQRSLDKMNTYISTRSHMPLETFERKLAYQLWTDGEDSFTDGFVDSLVVLTTVPNEEVSFNPFEEKSIFKPVLNKGK